MNLKQLEYFVVVAEKGGFAAASRLLNIAQSAISRQVAALEEDLQVVLFLRQGRTTALTPAGQRLFEDARDILLRVERMKVNARGSREVATLMIGSRHSFGNFMFPRLTVALSRQGQQIAVGFVQGPTDRLSAMMDSGELDIAILTTLETEPPVIPALEFTPLCDEQVYLVGHRDRLRDTSPVGISEALSRPLILLPRDSRERRSYEALARGLGVTLKVAADAENLTLMFGLARSQVGLILVPRAGLMDGGGGELVAAPVEGLSLRRWIVRHRLGRHDRSARRVCDIILKLVESEDGFARIRRPGPINQSSDTAGANSTSHPHPK